MCSTFQEYKVMISRAVLTFIAICSFAASAAFFFGVNDEINATSVVGQPASYIVQGKSADSVAAIVQSVGGDITHELGVIRAVGATLTPAQAEALRLHSDVQRLYGNGSIEVAGKPGGGNDPNNDPQGGDGGNGIQETHYPTRVFADSLHVSGIDGSGVGIAVLDTGLWNHNGIKYDSAGNARMTAVYNAITNEVAVNPMNGNDPGGHGSHVASIAVSSLVTDAGNYNGIAPGAHLVSVQAFDELGQGSYADVIRAIDWVVANKATHNIRVLNLSFSAEPRSHYWDDPINQAVMVAWQQDIVVVAAAGNRGPAAMTIGVPGNVPYVVTVGAMTDNYTEDDQGDDFVASFSSAGPTHEGFVKPDVVVPGGHMLGLMPSQSHLATTYSCKHIPA
jgi:serine protease AprX